MTTTRFKPRFGSRFTRIMMALVCLIAPPAYADDEVDVTAKFQTNYDRGTGVQNQNRGPGWEDAQMVGQPPNPAIIGQMSPEVSQASIAGGQAASSSNLFSMFERIELHEEYVDLYDRIHEMGTEVTAPNYGHEGDLTDLEGRAEQMADHMLN